uniref:Uncharacterized protein n=1 Tax=Micromonas pusilla TaxID=38833 RepID=A0A7S0IM79_MICPS
MVRFNLSHQDIFQANFPPRRRDGEPPLAARGQAADDLAARARVLKLFEADGVEELVHLGGALGDVEVAAAAGLKSACTAVSALCARSAAGHQSACTAVCALCARSAVGARIPPRLASDSVVNLFLYTLRGVRLETEELLKW